MVGDIQIYQWKLYVIGRFLIFPPSVHPPRPFGALAACTCVLPNAREIRLFHDVAMYPSGVTATLHPPGRETQNFTTLRRCCRRLPFGQRLRLHVLGQARQYLAVAPPRTHRRFPFASLFSMRFASKHKNSFFA